jgi:hypothetical protein
MLRRVDGDRDVVHGRASAVTRLSLEDESL